VLQGFAGVTAAEFEELEAKAEPIWRERVITPFKKSKLHPLTDEQKLLNQEFSRGRIIVENPLCQFKHFGVLAQRFRHNVDKYDNAFRSVLAIVNPRIQKRVAAAAMA
jgi:hypothetical protein